MRKSLAVCLIGVGLLAAGAAQAQSGQVTVLATDVIYAAGTQSGVAASAQGTVPAGVIDLPPGTTAVYLLSVSGSLFTDGPAECVSPEGCITINTDEPTNLNDPDGAHAQVKSSSNQGAGSISGISAPGAGFLVGVFIAAGGPSGPAPKALNFMSVLSTSRSQGSPKLDQTFFIGDGKTGDDSGDHQVFKVPAGAAQLVLGISDACGYSGSPSCYYDNAGAYTVKYGLLPSSN